MTPAAVPVPRLDRERCDSCGAALSRSARRCRACGRAVVEGVLALPSPGAPSTRRALRAAAGAAGALVVAAVVVGAGYPAFDEWRHPRGLVAVNLVGARSAHITFDDRPALWADTGAVIERVAPGRHTLVVESPGTVTFTTELTLEEGAPLLELQVPMKALPAHYDLDSDPRGARIRLDGVDTGLLTPARVEVESHTQALVRFELDGYQPESTTLTGLPGDGEGKHHTTLRQRDALAPSASGQAAHAWVTVASTPAGAAVFLDGQDTGLRTPATLDVQSGVRHDIKLELAGSSAPRSTTVERLAPDELRRLHVAFD